MKRWVNGHWQNGLERLMAGQAYRWVIFQNPPDLGISPLAEPLASAFKVKSILFRNLDMKFSSNFI